MEDINQIHGSTQTNEFLNSGEYKDEIATKIGIKDFFPKTKKIIAHKNIKNQLEPLEILNKFRKKVFGVSDYQKKLTFKAKKNQKILKLGNENSHLTLEVKKLLPGPTTAKSLFSGTHSFFPKFNGVAVDKDKKTFITDINRSKSKSKTQNYFLNKAKDEAPDNDTAYSSYVLKDFASPNKNEFDVNLNYNTFYALFNKEKKFFKDKKFSAKNVAEFEKEKKHMNKIERRIQTEFLQKISFPPNDKFMNKTVNNFNFNKGLYKINDLRGSLTSADKIASMVIGPDKAAKSSLSPRNDLIRDFSSINANQHNNKNFNRTGFNFARGANETKENFNSTAQNFHRKCNFNLNNFNESNNNFNNDHKNLNNNFNDDYDLKRKYISLERGEKRGNTSEANMRRRDYYTKNKHVFNDLDNLYKNKFGTEGTEEDELLASRSKNIRNFNIQKGLFSGRESPKKEFRSYDLSDNLEKRNFTFNLNQGSNAHVLHMLRINQKHEKLGLTKRIKLGPNNGLNEKVLREKLKNNLDGIVKRQQNQFNTNYNIKNRNEFAKSNFQNNYKNIEGLTFNVTFNTFNYEKSKFLKINKNFFNTKDIPDEERKYYESKKDKDYAENKNNKCDHENNNNNYIGSNNIHRRSDLNNSESKNLEKYSMYLDEEKSNVDNKTNLNESSSNNNNYNLKNNDNFSEKIEALNVEYENKKDLSLLNNIQNKDIEAKLGGNNHLLQNVDRESEGILFKEKNEIVSSKENNELISSPHASMEQIISKKTFENIHENSKINNPDVLAGNQDIGVASKRNVVLKGKQSSKNGTLSLIKNSNINDIKTGRGTKTTLLQRQANNQDISGLQIDCQKDQ